VYENAMIIDFKNLKATDGEVGLLLDFGTKPEVKRKAFNNLRK